MEDNVLCPPILLWAVREPVIPPSLCRNLLSPGNCGCAFLQLTWVVPPGPWTDLVTLLPATMLMSLADSKQGKNRSGVRMFKDGKEREFPGGLGAPNAGSLGSIP